MKWAYRQKHWLSDPASYPLIAILAGAGLFCTGFGVHFLTTAPDVQISPLKRWVLFIVLLLWSFLWQIVWGVQALKGSTTNKQTYNSLVFEGTKLFAIGVKLLLVITHLAVCWTGDKNGGFCGIVIGLYLRLQGWGDFQCWITIKTGQTSYHWFAPKN